MEIAFSCLLLVYLVLILACWFTWRRIGVPDLHPLAVPLPSVSVVIAMRDEENNLPALINSLLAQDYPKTNFEVIIADDASRDKSVEILRELTVNSALNLKIITLSDPVKFEGSYKKRALTAAIEQARFPYIATTDADCICAPNWLSATMAFMQEKGARFVSGPVVFLPANSLVQALKDQEFAALTGIGASFLTWGYPNMCNGANLAFAKEAFIEVDGYRGYEQVISGDDEFLLYKIHQRYAGNVYFFKHPQAIVKTLAPENWSTFIDQRKRWAGKWKHHRSLATKTLALLIFAFHSLWLAALVLALTGTYSWTLLGVQLTIKIIVEFLLIQSVMNFQSKKVHLPWFLLGQLLYSCYVVFFGIFANWGNYHWKNRRFK